MSRTLRLTTTYYSNCTHCCIRETLQGAVDEYSGSVERHGAKRDRKNRYTITFSTDGIPEQEVEEACRSVIRSGPIQQWKVNWTGT